MSIRGSVIRREWSIAVGLLLLAACGERFAPPSDSLLARSGDASALIARLNRDFSAVAQSSSFPQRRPGRSPQSTALFGSTEVERLISRGRGLEPQFRGGKTAKVRATVVLPERADGATHVSDPETGLALTFMLRGSASSFASFAEQGYAVYRSALSSGGDMISRITRGGVEDYFYLSEPPTNSSLEYDVELSNVAGLRLIDGNLEFLSNDGAPRLHIARPFIKDMAGRTQYAQVEVVGPLYSLAVLPDVGAAPVRHSATLAVGQEPLY